MKKTGIIVLAVALVLVIGVEAFVFLHLRSRAAETGPAAAAAITESPVMTQAPPPTAEPVTPTPAPTSVPVTPTPVPTAVPTAEPSPVPTAEPTATPVASYSGSCSSDTGVGLNMTVDWKTENLGNGTTRVYVTGKITSYSLTLGSTSVTVTLGGQSVTCEAPSFAIGEVGETVSDLFSTSLDVPSGTTAELKVDWDSKCTYSGVALVTITATDSVTT